MPLTKLRERERERERDNLTFSSSILVWNQRSEREIEMDLLPTENLQIAKKHRFRSLKLVNVDFDQEFQHQPFGVDYGRLDNGLVYYVRSNSKPRMRAALALAVKVGLVLLLFPLILN